jgi:hypothetical protein
MLPSLTVITLCPILKDRRMNFKSTLLILTLLTFCKHICQGQTQVIIPNEFIETVPPKPGSDDWYLLNHSKNEFAVEFISGKLEIKKVDPVDECELKISNGKLVGINKGEWGGTLSFIPSDSTKNKTEIKSGNVKFIFSFNDKIYFIEGLAHLSLSSGTLYELDINKNSFNYKKMIDFDGSPEAFTIYNDRFLIATHNKFYIVKDFNKELVVQDVFWESLYPNSIAVLDDQNVFIGIRSGIVKIDLTTKKIKFYKNV